MNQVGNWTAANRNNLCTHCKTMQRRLLPFVHTYLFAEPTQNKSVGQQVLIFAKRKKQGISTLSISLPPQQYLLLSPWISCIYKILILPSIFFSDGHPPPVAEHDVLRSQLLRSNPVASAEFPYEAETTNCQSIAKHLSSSVSCVGNAFDSGRTFPTNQLCFPTHPTMKNPPCWPSC